MKIPDYLPVILICALVIILALNNGGTIHHSPEAEYRTASVALTDTVEWERPRFSEREEERHRMVEQHIAREGITDEKVLEAMRHVPRHRFVAPGYENQAYRNAPLPIQGDQTISQPFIVAHMTQQLDLEAGERVLEIGTGSGYQAAVLSEITPHVFTIEIVPELGELAKSRFDEMGYSTIETKIGDGYEGWEEHAPFDGIILTAASEQIPEPLKEQLAAGGRLVMPMGNPQGIQMLVLVTKSEDGELSQKSLLPVRFVPMTGKTQNGN